MSNNILESEVFTYQLTADTLVITESMGVKQVSVFNGTTTVGTVLGNKTLGALASAPIDVDENDTFTVRAVDGSVIKTLTINAPAGCTLKIVAQ